GKTLLQLSRYQEAYEFFKRSADLDPYLRSAYYGQIMALRQMRKMKEALAAMKEFRQLKQNPRARLLEFKYTKMGRNAEVTTIDVPQNRIKNVKKPSGRLFQEPQKLIDTPGIRWSRPKGRAIASAAACPINGDNYGDIFIPGALELANGTGNAVLTGGSDGNYTLVKDHPLAAIDGVNAALWGDIDNNGTVDVYLCRKGPNMLFLRDNGNGWRDVTEQSKTADGSSDTWDGALFDADHDGDLDIFLVNHDGANELLNNNRDGTFRPLAADYKLEGKGDSKSIMVCDIDTDRDADIIVINGRAPHEVYANMRLWKYEPAAGFDSFKQADIAAAVVGDVDADGLDEIYTLDSKAALYCWKLSDKGTRESTRLAGGRKKTTTGHRLILNDVDGDGRQDLLVADGNNWRVLVFKDGGMEELFKSTESTEPAAWCLIQSSRGPGLMLWSPGQVPYIHRPGSGRYPFISFFFSGMENSEASMRSNASGIGTRFSLRFGSQWAVLSTTRNHSGPGQGFQPISIGLAGAQRADFATMEWSDGVFQTELDLETGKTHKITETQRQLSSCPVIFAWNGETYEFVSDFLGVGGIGYAVGPGEYSQPRPWENFMFARGAVKPENGRLKMKLTEPMEESAYLDNVRLRAYDVPPGWSMTLDERMAILGPAATGEPLYYRNMILPETVFNDRKQDVTASVRERDLKAAPVGSLDTRFIGRLQSDHVLTLTFARALDSLPGRPVLVADGWVEYPYSQTNFAAWQAGADYRAPTIEVYRADGQWVTLMEQFGYPAGMPRQMSVPLQGLPKGVRKIRISTNQEVYWDRLAVVFAEECPEAEQRLLNLEAAQLERTGFPQRNPLPQRLPYYDYDKRVPFWDTHFLEGFYTRFGDVRELVAVKDNGLLIFGAGEGVHLEFAEPEPLATGWTRVYVLETEGWCKDMDLFTNTGDTLAPIPHSGAIGKRAKELNETYNTRYLGGRQ
ncbi:MAG: hypothetical protein GY765_20665, partial [bacterium]|nr:hypothetical protein [bacterium]